MILRWNSFRQLRFLRRYRQILRILVKYGFAQILDQLNLYGIWERLLFWRRQPDGENTHHPAVRLRMALEELGPAFVKVGQLMSTRTDLLPPSYTAQLSRLQDDVKPFPAQVAKQILEAELNAPLEQLFKHFDPEPLAAASLGQVHRAVLAGGEDVVVKVKRPGVDKQVAGDLGILVDLAVLVEKKAILGPEYQLTRLAEELRKIITRELDYNAEARNAQRFRNNYAGNPQVAIPDVYWRFTTANVLTLEYRRGLPLSSYLKNPGPEPDPRRVAEALTETFFKQYFIDGFFHGDPHPGNILLLPDEGLFLMDFGSAGFISEELRGRFILIFQAFQNIDPVSVVDELLSFTFVPPVVNRSELIRDVRLLQEQYYDLPLKDINLSEVLQNLMQVAARHRLRFPYEFLLLVKSLITLEGTVARLDPDYNIFEAVKQYGPALKRKQLRFTAKRAEGLLRSYRRLLEEIPERSVEILRETAAGELKIKVELTQGDAIIKTLEVIFNRLAFSVVLASLIIALAQNIQLRTMPWLAQLPLGEIALIGAGIAGIWWLFAIIRSGRL